MLFYTANSNMAVPFACTCMARLVQPINHNDDHSYVFNGKPGKVTRETPDFMQTDRASTRNGGEIWNYRDSIAMVGWRQRDATAGVRWCGAIPMVCVVLQ
jgi:hypothetical protein